jgi:two-component system response regulator FixJ
MSAAARVYVVDDDEMVRTSLTLQLQPAYDVMCFAIARHFLDAASALPPGCLLLDLRMPEIDGLEVQSRLAERRLNFPTVMITGQGDVRTAVEAMRAGAIDFVEKPFTRATIEESIRLAGSSIARASTTRESVSAAAAKLAALSARERQVLDGLVAGLPNKTIAYDLGISARTVEMHRAHVMAKTQVRSLSALVRLAFAAGIDGAR